MRLIRIKGKADPFKDLFASFLCLYRSIKVFDIKYRHNLLLVEVLAGVLWI